MEIPEIKANLSILTVLQHYGISVNKSNLAKCPFHEDKTASMQIYPSTNTYNCFGCGKTGDVIQFIQDKEKTDKHNAILKAGSLVGNDKIMNDKMIKSGSDKVIIADKSQILAERFSYFKNAFHNSTPAKDYAKQRGLDYKLIEVGYNSAQFHHGARRDETLIQNCVSINLLLPFGQNSRVGGQAYAVFGKYSIVFALKNRANQITGLYFRSTVNEDKQKHYYLKDRSGLYPNYPKQNTTKLILTEAVIDAASLLQLQINNEELQSFEILACYGTNGLTKEHIEAIKELKQLKEIVFAFDNDEAGNTASLRYAEQLKVINEQLRISKIELPCKDVNETFISHEPEIFTHLLESRKQLFSSIEKNIKSSNEEKKEKDLIPNIQPPIPNLNTDNPHKLHYTSVAANYYIQGGISRILDSMKVTLVIENLESLAKSRNKVDLYEDKQVEKLCKEASEKLNIRNDILEADIYKLTDLLDEYREKELSNKNEELKEKESRYHLTQQEMNQAMDILKKQKLIYYIGDMLGQAGIVGEEKNRMFLFVAVVSHITKETLHVLIQGTSGSGKTRQLRVISDCMPPEKVIRLTRVSDKSFYNYPENYLSNKLVSLEDVDGLSEEAEFAYRELVSNGELISSISIKDESGKINSGQKIVRGPIASMACTTNGGFYEDNISRMFIVAVDESKEQTLKVIAYQNAKSAGKIDGKKENEIKKQLQHVVRMLKPLPVVNPYADQIHLPEEAHKLRRLNDLFKIFIHQITLINQYQRKKDEYGKLISTLVDVETAIDIMFESIVLKVDELDGSLRQFYEKLKDYIKQKNKERYQEYQFTQREIRHSLNISKSQLFRYLNDLSELEYIQQSGGFANRGFKYKIIYWDDYKALREKIKRHLIAQVEDIKLKEVKEISKN